MKVDITKLIEIEKYISDLKTYYTPFVNGVGADAAPDEIIEWCDYLLPRLRELIKEAKER